MKQHDLLESQSLSVPGDRVQLRSVTVQNGPRSVQRFLGTELNASGQVEDQRVVRFRASEELASVLVFQNLGDRLLSVVEQLLEFLLLEQEIHVEHVGRSQLEVPGGGLCVCECGENERTGD